MRKQINPLLKQLHIDMEQVTGLTAIAVSKEMKKYDAYPDDVSDEDLKPQKDINDNIAASVMSRQLEEIDRSVNMLIGEGVKDIMLGHNIEIVEGNFGQSETKNDGANDPLEGTTLSVKKKNGVSSVVAITEPGGIIEPPDDVVRMEKLFAPMIDGLSINDDPHVTVEKVAEGLGVLVNQIRVSILDRPRHNYLKQDLKGLVEDELDLDMIEAGDLLPSLIASNKPDSSGKYNIVLGVGGMPEGIISAAAAKATGNTFVEARWWNEEEWRRKDLQKVLKLEDLIPGNPETIVVKLAHITSYSSTLSEGVRKQQDGNAAHLVDFTSVDMSGIISSTVSFRQ